MLLLRLLICAAFTEVVLRLLRLQLLLCSLRVLQVLAPALRPAERGYTERTRREEAAAEHEVPLQCRVQDDAAA